MKILISTALITIDFSSCIFSPSITVGSHTHTQVKLTATKLHHDAIYKVVTQKDEINLTI